MKRTENAAPVPGVNPTAKLVDPKVTDGPPSQSGEPACASSHRGKCNTISVESATAPAPQLTESTPTAVAGKAKQTVIINDPINADNTPLSPAEQQEYNRCCEVIKRGPRTAKAIGEPLWTIEHKRLYRPIVGNMETFFPIVVGIEPDQGFKLIAEWEAMTGHTASSTEPPRPLAAWGWAMLTLPFSAFGSKRKGKVRVVLPAAGRTQPVS